MRRVKVYPSPSFKTPGLKTKFIPTLPVEVVVLFKTRDWFLKLRAAHRCADERGKKNRRPREV